MASPASVHPAVPSEIERSEIRARLGDTTLAIVDVLPRESYANAHIPGALNLPAAEVETRAEEMLPSRAQEIAVYCGSAT